MDNKLISSIPNSKNKTPIIIGAVVIILAAAGVYFWYFGGKIPFTELQEQGAAIEVKDGLGEEKSNLNFGKNKLILIFNYYLS